MLLAKIKLKKIYLLTLASTPRLGTSVQLVDLRGDFDTFVMLTKVSKNNNDNMIYYK